ncbi:transketolase family protein [Enterocloster sp. OA13]|uniref:transketolase family protein n=1 Tax=Enterocloster sp. OA13 TaxID=2914161 RepID=UPI00046FF887|nr:transketolase family protein [Enterocloster sp. OA13]
MHEMISTRVAYGEALAALGEKNEKVVVLDADLAHATMTATFERKFPERFFNAGIAEANMMDMGAGLSTMGYIPFCSTFAIFGAGRAFEQVRNGIAYPGLNVKLGMTHAGITLGEDGGSHESIEDIALMRVIPGMTILSPCDAKETRKAVEAAAQIEGPVYLRLARLPSRVFDESPFEVGKANVLRDGTDMAIFTTGVILSNVLDAVDALEQDGYSIAVINIHTIKPIDRECIEHYACKCPRLVTVEEHSIIGGLGDAVMDVVEGRRKVVKIGILDRFGQSGKPEALLEEYGLSIGRIKERLQEEIK